MMQITLNGQAHELPCPTTLTTLLESLGLAGKPVVAELNREAVLPRHFPETRIIAGDSLEIITLAAGG
jgi:sulfur carrier protein